MSTLETMLLVYQVAISLVLFSLLWVTLVNVLHFQRLPKRGSVTADNSPLVSVLVPARNEARCVEACVESLCQQRYPNLEVIVLDDGSSDATPDILRRLQVKHSNLTVVEGKPLPEGWVGKPWACHQLSELAQGEYLLFTDADTIHSPHSVDASVQLLHDQKLDFFSLIPLEEMGTFGEHVVIPMVHVLFFSYLPSPLLHRSQKTTAAAANGQFMFFKATSYDSIDGHRSVRNALVEDVYLAKVLKGAGMRIALVDGTQHVRCRMYTSAREVTRGFSKNFFPGTGYNLPVTILFLVHLVTAFVAPLFFVLAGLAVLSAQPELMLESILAWGLFALPMSHIMIMAIVRLVLALRFQMPWWHMLLMPVTAIWSVMIGINSIRWAYSPRGSEWKGRSYSRQGRT
jgi:chlorobactene glucosyltransferase